MKMLQKILFTFACGLAMTLAVSAQKNDDPKKPPPKNPPPVINPQPKNPPPDSNKPKPGYAVVTLKATLKARSDEEII